MDSLAALRQRYLPLREREKGNAPYWLMRCDSEGRVDNLGMRVMWRLVDEGCGTMNVSPPLRDVAAAEEWWREFAGS